MYAQQQRRRSASPPQVWAVGEMVQVGFLRLRIVEQQGSDWILVNRDGSRRYRFEPYNGLFSL